MKIQLSKLNLEMDCEELFNYLHDNKFETVVNDLTPVPNIEYSAEEIYSLWDTFKEILK